MALATWAAEGTLNHGWVLAAAANEPLEVVERLLVSHLHSIGEMENPGAGLTLDLAAKYGAPADLLKLVLSRRPAACSERRGGRLPLHWLAEKCAPPEVVQLVLAANPPAISTKDTSGSLPLHLAAAGHAPVEVVRALLEAYPAALGEQDGRGLLPLHLAAGEPERCCCGYAGYRVARCQCATGTIGLLVDADPIACEVEAGWKGELPLHLALNHGASPAVIRRLLEHYPDAILARSRCPFVFRVPPHCVVGMYSVR